MPPVSDQSLMDLIETVTKLAQANNYLRAQCEATQAGLLAAIFSLRSGPRDQTDAFISAIDALLESEKALSSDLSRRFVSNMRTIADQEEEPTPEQLRAQFHLVPDPAPESPGPEDH